MKKTEVQLPDGVYEELQGISTRRHVTIAELLGSAAEEYVKRQAKHQFGEQEGWRFPEGRHLGAFLAPAEDWRLLANETVDPVK